MVDGIVKILDRIIDLLDRRAKSRRDSFNDFIEPTYSELTLIHGDYLAALRELLGMASNANHNGTELKQKIDLRREGFVALRSKVSALAVAIKGSKADEYVLSFAEKIEDYFSNAL
jgi:hypothetical protein